MTTSHNNQMQRRLNLCGDDDALPEAYHFTSVSAMCRSNALDDPSAMPSKARGGKDYPTDLIQAGGYHGIRKREFLTKEQKEPNA